MKETEKINKYAELSQIVIRNRIGVLGIEVV